MRSRSFRGSMSKNVLPSLWRKTRQDREEAPLSTRLGQWLVGFGSKSRCCWKDVACSVCAVRELQTNAKRGLRCMHAQGSKACPERVKCEQMRSVSSRTQMKSPMSEGASDNLHHVLHCHSMPFFTSKSTSSCQIGSSEMLISASPDD
jgi:hypothetical protein